MALSVFLLVCILWLLMPTGGSVQMQANWITPTTLKVQMNNHRKYPISMSAGTTLLCYYIIDMDSQTNVIPQNYIKCTCIGLLDGGTNMEEILTMPQTSGRLRISISYYELRACERIGLRLQSAGVPSAFPKVFEWISLIVPKRQSEASTTVSR